MKPISARSSNADFAGEWRKADAPTPTFVARLVLAALRGYKLVFSLHFTGACRFMPTCADYARDAVMTHGALYGSWLAARRLARCHPFCRGGHDPVPSGRGRSSYGRTPPAQDAGRSHSGRGFPGEVMR